MMRLTEYGTAETGFRYTGYWQADPPRVIRRSVKVSISDGVLTWELIEGYTPVATTGTIATKSAKLTPSLRKQLDAAFDAASRNEKD